MKIVMMEHVWCDVVSVVVVLTQKWCCDPQFRLFDPESFGQ